MPRCTTLGCSSASHASLELSSVELVIRPREAA